MLIEVALIYLKHVENKTFCEIKSSWNFTVIVFLTNR